MTQQQPRTSVPRRVWGGTGLLVLGRFWGSACTLVMLWLLARKLSSEGFGRYTYFLTIFALLDSLADFGTGQVAVQKTAGDPAAVPAVLGATRRIRFAMGSIGVLLVGGAAFWTREPGAVWILAASLYPVTHVLALSTTVFSNRIALSIPTLIRVITSTAQLAAVVLLMRTDTREPAHYLFAVALASTCGNVLQHLASRPHLPRERAHSIPLADVLRATLPLGAASLCQQAYFYADNLFVRPICGNELLGHYNVGMRVMSYTIMVAILATQAALPWLAREHARGELANAIARLTQPLFALAGLGAGLLWPWTELLLEHFGPGFSDAGPSLRWLLCATAMIYAGSGLMTAVVAAGKMRAMLVIAVIGLLTNLAANAVLVPSMGIEGAGLATFITEAAVTLSAAAALARIGVRPWGGARGLGWLAGPVLFVVAALLSSLLPLARVTTGT